MDEGGTGDHKPTAVIVGILCFILTGSFAGNGDYASGVIFAVIGLISVIVILKTDSGEESWASSLKGSSKAGLEAAKWWLIGGGIAYLFITFF